jgi:3-hydroxybutyrate dehydrogenase
VAGDLDGRAAVVTGAAGGIGRAITARLEREGMRVLAVDLRPDDDGPGEPFVADLTTRDGNQTAIEAAVERFGRLDAIIPNAGFSMCRPWASSPRTAGTRSCRSC